MRNAPFIVSLSAALFLVAYLPTSEAQSNTASENKILVLRMQVVGDRHQVLEVRVVSSPVALTKASSSNESLGFLATDAKGALLQSGGMEDPLIVTSPLPLPGESMRTHEVIVRTAAQYLLRLPYETKMKHVYVGKGMAVTPGMPQEKLATITRSPTVTAINLDEWLPVR